MHIINGIILILILLTIVMFFRHQVQSTIKGLLKFVESPQMKLDKDSFPMNMIMVELEGKKVMVRPSQAESTKGKELS
jgi:hypothetical protein